MRTFFVMLVIVFSSATVGWCADEMAAEEHAATTVPAVVENHAETSHAETSADSTTAHAETTEHAVAHSEEHAAKEQIPVLPVNVRWAGVALIIIGGLFLMAAVIGPVVRANAPEEIPVAHAHDEPPGSSHHHGHSGTLNPAPDDPGHVPGGGHGHH